MKFSELLKSYRDSRNLQKAELAAKLEVSPGYIYTLESGKRDAPPLELCRRISEALDLSPEENDEFMRAAAEERLPEEEREIFKGSLKSKDFSPVKLAGHTVKIPVVGLVSAGSVDPFLDANEFIEIDSSLLGDNKVIGIRMMGDCLTDKGIFDKDIVFVSKDAPVHDGDVAVVRIDNSVTCKVVRHIPGKPPSLLLEAANKNDPWRRIISPKDSDIIIIGKVVGSYKRFS